MARISCSSDCTYLCSPISECSQSQTGVKGNKSGLTLGLFILVKCPLKSKKLHHHYSSISMGDATPLLVLFKSGLWTYVDRPDITWNIHRGISWHLRARRAQKFSDRHKDGCKPDVISLNRRGSGLTDAKTL